MPYLLFPAKTIQVDKASLTEILTLFLNTLTADDKYSLLNRGNLLKEIQMHLSEERKVLSNFFSDFLNLHSISNIFKKKMMVRRDKINV